MVKKKCTSAKWYKMAFIKEKKCDERGLRHIAPNLFKLRFLSLSIHFSFHLRPFSHYLHFVRRPATC